MYTTCLKELERNKSFIERSLASQIDLSSSLTSTARRPDSLFVSLNISLDGPAAIA